MHLANVYPVALGEKSLSKMAYYWMSTGLSRLTESGEYQWEDTASPRGGKDIENCTTNKTVGLALIINILKPSPDHSIVIRSNVWETQRNRSVNFGQCLA